MSRDGGYHAIKGFAFQFDASLLQIFANPGFAVEIEGAQDIGVRSFHIQVKHRSRNYSPSRIAPAVRQMMQQFVADQGARFALYCHFPDRSPGETLRIGKGELEAALGDLSDAYADDVKSWFIKSFEVVFAPDFAAQFHLVINHLKRTLRARSEAEALCWHAVIHSHLRDTVLRQPPGERRVSLADLKNLVSDARAAVFEASYAQICGHEKYLRLIREQYKSATVNVPNRERLFIIECGDQSHDVDLVDSTIALRRRFFVGDSPAPYVSFRGATDLVRVKGELWRAGVYFHDGHDYGGAQFSAASLVAPSRPGHGIKLVDFEHLEEIVNHVKVREVHDFYSTDPIVNPFSEARVRHVIVDSPSDVLKILKGRE
ncbi:hypothetical protein [Streptomyces sp. NPDC047071]|uniref:hypothetical protein n=1 Tax=Streptomyces sp. NPDC047071 TaxID=3154808 RepID=UPI0034537E9B